MPGKCSKYIEQISDSIDDIDSWKILIFSLTHSSFNKGTSWLLEFCLDTYLLASLADLCSGVSISRRYTIVKQLVLTPVSFLVLTAPAKEFKAVNNSIIWMIWVMIDKLEDSV